MKFGLILTLIFLISTISFAFQKTGKTTKDVPFFPKTPKPETELFYLNLLEKNNSLPEKFALTVLQGLVNRDGGRIYITQPTDWHENNNLQFWVDNLRKKGYNFTEINNPFELFSTFKNNYKGAVIYEDNLFDNPLQTYKINSLTLYCAINDLVPLTPSLNSKLNIPVIFDTRGKYLTAKDAQDWVREEMWDKASKDVIAHTNPSHMTLKDYLVMHKIYPIWIGAGMTRDEETQALKFIEDINPNSPVMGCWGGYGEEPAGIMREPLLTRLCSNRGKFMLVTDGCQSLSIHAGLGYNKPKAEQVNSKRKIELDESKTYICFSVTDGDNLQYLQIAFLNEQWWNNKERGNVPVNWGFSPLAYELIPDMMEYFIETKTSLDGITSEAGAGLIAPSIYGKDVYGNNVDILKNYFELSAKSIEASGFTSIRMADTSDIALTRDDCNKMALAMPNLSGILCDYGGPALGLDRNSLTFFTENNIPVIRCSTFSPDGDRADNPTQKWIEKIKTFETTVKPGFMHIAVINWYDSPESIKKVIDELGNDYVAVTAEELFDLVKQAQRKE